MEYIKQNKKLTKKPPSYHQEKDLNLPLIIQENMLE
jgi:hypothetical protein